jgi:hypothetical protein
MKTTVEKEFLGNQFVYSTDVDKATGKALWTKEIDMQFSKWLYALKNKDRELFKVQYSISSNAYQVFERLKDMIGVYDDSLLVRAIAITFINHVDTRKGRSVLKRLGEYKKSPDLEALKEGETLKKNLYFSPNGMRDIEAYASLTGLKKSAVVQNALYSVLLISINEDTEIKKFWEEVILGQLSTIAKAA